MSSAAVPAPIVFSLSLAETVRIRENVIRETGATRTYPLVALSAALQLYLTVDRLYGHHGHDPAAWFLVVGLAVLFVAAVAAFGWARWWFRFFIRPQEATVVSFGADGLDIVEDTPRGLRASHAVPFEKIRSVRLTPDALLVTGRWKLILIVPRRALPDDGAPIMAFFDERLMSKRMLRRSRTAATNIVNTVFP